MKQLFWFFLVSFTGISGFPQSLTINEICYTNKNILRDSQGKTPDWFELYNAGKEILNLSDYLITDNLEKDEYWQIPDYYLAPGSYLIVYASGKDTIIGSEFHTTFKLGSMKESLYLVDRNNQVIDSMEPQCVPADLSLARIPDGSDNIQVIHPSPGNSNNSSEVVAIHYVYDTLMVNYSSGLYGSPISLVFSNSNPANTIVYTVDGEEPDEASAIYSEPLLLKDLTNNENRFANKVESEYEPGNLIFKANIVRAVVYSSGCPASNEITGTYFIGEAIKGRYQVPLVSLITEKDNLFDDETGIYVKGEYRNFDQHGKDWERPVHVEIFDSAGYKIIDQDAGMRIHGRGSRRSPQKSLRLYADEEYGKNSFNHPFFKQKPLLDEFKVLLLRTTGGTLGSLFKEELCNYLVRNMNADPVAGHTAILFINGEYWGIYNFSERQNKEYIENNLGIQDAELDIIAYDRRVVAEEGTTDEYDRLISFLQNSDPADTLFYPEADKMMDLYGLMDYYIAQFYFANIDWPLSNVELWKLKSDTARWHYFFFDLDAGMMWLDYDHLTEYVNTIDDYQRFPEFSTIILQTLMRNNEFRRKFFSRFCYHMNHTFRSDLVLDAIERFESKYAPLVPEQVYRWNNPVDYRKWEENVESLKSYALQRPLVIMEQLQRDFGNPYRLYPNPSNGFFYLDLMNASGKFVVKVFSLKGEMLYTSDFGGMQGGVLPVSTGLPEGVYILQITTDFNVFTNRIVIN